MRCYNPIGIVNKEKSTRHNIVKEVVPCGQCVCCRINESEDWANRLEYQQHYSKNAFFLTFTYSEEHLPKDGELKKEDFQNFMKRLRQNFIYANYGKQDIKYFTVGEYGETFGRPHFHSIMFDLPIKGQTLSKVLVQTWKLGFVDVRPVIPARIRYVTGYMVKRNKAKEIFKKETEPFRLTSNGLGIDYVKKNKDYHNEDYSRIYLVKAGNKKARLPRYYREKIFTKETRQVQKDTFQVINDDLEESMANKYLKKKDKMYKKHMYTLEEKYIMLERKKHEDKRQFKIKVENKQNSKNYEHF